MSRLPNQIYPDCLDMHQDEVDAENYSTDEIMQAFHEIGYEVDDADELQRIAEGCIFMLH